MRAVLCRTLGPPEALAVEEVPSPRPGPRQVLVSVRAAGVNFPDTLVIQGKYQLRPELPFSPGSEFAGVVKEVGAEVRGLAPGDRVVAFAGWGGFAEEALAEAGNVFPLPSEVEFPSAAALAMAYGTSLHALQDRARLRHGETLLVLGAAGGVGLAAVELGKLMGARVIAAASDEARLQACREQGADELVSYADDGWRDAVKRLTSGRGVDVVYDPVGGALAEPAVRLMAWEGRYLVVGFAGGDIPRIPLNLPLLKGCAITGVFWGEFTRRDPAANREHMGRLLGWLAQGRLRPRISRTFPLEGAAEALQALLARRVTGKLVLLVPPPPAA
ncbi:MAG TPA: NADPH:quinone oxidoreductase family protein [Anaeromyxobacteraceae bacterium]|nr:NADPH:quinone oxidoreductase family protein [Anaeromyxobacteraceae bacterium]